MEGPKGAWQAYRRSGGGPIRDEDVEKYLPLVKHIAARLALGLPAHVDVDDLYSYGIFGLLDALAKFDPARGVKFETYAYTRIKGAIVDGLRAMDWAPASLRQRARHVEEAYWRVESQKGQPATDEEVAAEMGIPTAEFQRLLQDLERAAVLSLDEVWTGEGEDGEFTLRDVVADPAADDPLDNAQMQVRRQELAACIDRLPEKERLVMSLFYYDGLAPKEIAAIMHLSVSRISQLHSKAVLRLRGQLQSLRSALT